MPQMASFGSWKSPLDARQVAEGTTGLGEVLMSEEAIYWDELRPAEAGRNVVVRRPWDGAATDVAPQGFNARTRVHEYGGGAYLPVGDTVIFANYADQRLYRTTSGGPPQPITPAGKLRYADFIWDRRLARLITVLEDHRREGEAVNAIAAVYPDEGGRVRVLASGGDFYSSPRLSPDGTRLAWLTWNHPNMPWDGVELWIAPVRSDGSLGEPMLIAGGPEESIVQPEWSPEGVLHFVSDRTDWWNLYRWRDGVVEPLTELQAEFGLPAWRFRMSSYGFDAASKIVCAYAQDGLAKLARLDPETRLLQPIQTPYSSISYLRVNGNRAAFIGGAADRPTAVVLMDLTTGRVEELRRASTLQVDPGYISTPQPIEFPTEDGLTSHGLFYPARNKDFVGPPEERPPLVVMVHGGPTAATSGSLRLGIQYYTSRGIAVLDVNYGGSTGYGRNYRQRLYGQWGVVDVDDCCNGAKFLASRGLVDGRRMAITGGSAGGYTTLAALAFRKVFAAGASHFGVSDCELLAKETHKFESRYLDRLIGPYPQRRDLYIERSPIHHVNDVSCPVIFFQGLEDKIVPPDQARIMADALGKKGVPVALLEFEGEQHGFRKAENICRALEAELYFFSRVFGFEPADRIESVKIENQASTALTGKTDSR